MVPDSGFMSRPSVAGFLLSPPGTAEAEEAGARGKRFPRRSPLGFLPRFFQFFVPRSGRRRANHQTSTEREAAARLPLPSPRRAAGGRQLAHRPGRFAQTPDSTAPVGPPRWRHYHHRAPEGAAPRRQRVLATPGADSRVTAVSSCPLTASAPWQLETVRGSVLLRPRAQVTAEATASGDMSVREKFLRGGAERWGGAPASGTGVAWAA